MTLASSMGIVSELFDTTVVIRLHPDASDPDERFMALIGPIGFQVYGHGSTPEIALGEALLKRLAEARDRLGPLTIQPRASAVTAVPEEHGR